MFVARTRATVSNSSATSKRRLASDTTVPPPTIAMSAENWPVPCINGQATTITGGAALAAARSATCSTVVAGSTPVSGLPPAPSTLKRSSWRHITPLGMPVVPPV